MCAREWYYSRTSLTNGFVAQVILGLAPVDRRCTVETERRLVVDVDSFGDVCERQDVDIVAGLRRSGLDRRRLDKAREAFSIALDRGVHPVTNRDTRASVRKASVDVARDGVHSC